MGRPCWKYFSKHEKCPDLYTTESYDKQRQLLLLLLLTISFRERLEINMPARNWKNVQHYYATAQFRLLLVVFVFLFDERYFRPDVPSRTIRFYSEFFSLEEVTPATLPIIRQIDKRIYTIRATMWVAIMEIDFLSFFGVVLLFLWGGLMTSGTRIHLHKRRRAYNVYIGLIFPKENIERNSQRHITHNNAQTHIHVLWLNLFFLL